RGLDAPRELADAEDARRRLRNCRARELAPVVRRYVLLHAGGSRHAAVIVEPPSSVNEGRATRHRASQLNSDLGEDRLRASPRSESRAPVTGASCGCGLRVGCLGVPQLPETFFATTKATATGLRLHGVASDRRRRTPISMHAEDGVDRNRSSTNEGVVSPAAPTTPAPRPSSTPRSP